MQQSVEKAGPRAPWSTVYIDPCKVDIHGEWTTAHTWECGWAASAIVLVGSPGQLPVFFTFIYLFILNTVQTSKSGVFMHRYEQ